jgi:hypothetical protein
MKSLKYIFTIIFLFYIIVSIVFAILFKIGCNDRLKRAADANTIELAKEELTVVISYLEEKNLTEGYTSILYKTPDEDIGFWYKNLNSSLNELKNVNPESSQLEKSNILLKLRETILDNSQSGSSVTRPDGISKYPFNAIFALWGGLSFIVSTFLWIRFAID